MNAEERQALREKHTYLGDYCGFCVKDGGYPADYPCDVIKVLDATEPPGTDIRASATSDVLPVNECDHPEGGLVPNGGDEFSMVEFAYCPKCGVEL